MSRSASRSSRPVSRSSALPSPVLPQFNNVMRRSRAFTQTPSSYRTSSRPSSRNSSRGRRSSITDDYKRRSISADRAKTFDDMIAQAGGVSRTTKIRRWDGNCRTTTNWDFLRKDPELWFPDGDTYVHYYSQGQSRRGPSLRLCLADIEASNCRPLLEKYCSRPVPETPPLPHQKRAGDGDYFTPREAPIEYELFIPAPSNLSREESMNYHLTTRNFFAWMFRENLVGARLSESLVGLKKRMDEWRPDEDENEDDFLAYIDDQGYTDFRDCPDHALAVLHWAEAYEHSELWTDAFVHCVGMHEQLVTSREFSHVPRSTIAMVTRANLEMSVRIDRASIALAGFLEEDDIINHHIRLSDPALKHMQRFRSFLHSFYVQRHGYWPPYVVQASGGRVRPLPKHTFLTMYTDFRNLYEFLVDAFADPFDQSEGTRSLVNVMSALDQRHKFTPLPHALPRLPDIDFNPTEQRRQRSFFSIFGNKKAKLEKRTMIATSLTNASNVHDIKVGSSAIVKEYAQFEREYTMKENERISASEARMARWTLVYALLQTLISVTTAPEEVRDVEGVDYPLCCQTAGTPPWKFNKPSAISVSASMAATPKPSTIKTSPTMSSIQLSSTSTETVTPATTPGEPPQPSPLDLSFIAERRASESVDKQSVTSPFPRSSALRPAVPPVPKSTAPSKAQVPAPLRTISTKQSRIPVPSSHSRAPTPSQAPTPPPIRPYSKARSEAMRNKSIKHPQPRRPMSGTFLDTYDTEASPPSLPTGNNSSDSDLALPSPINTDFDTSSIAGSAPTLLSNHDSDPDTAPPSTRSEHTPTPHSPSIYGGPVSIADSSDREFESHHPQPLHSQPTHSYHHQRPHSKSLSTTNSSQTHKFHPSKSSLSSSSTSHLSSVSGVDSVMSSITPSSNSIPYAHINNTMAINSNRDKVFSSQRAAMNPFRPSSSSNKDKKENGKRQRSSSKSSTFSLRNLNPKASRSTSSIHSATLGPDPVRPGTSGSMGLNRDDLLGDNRYGFGTGDDGMQEYGGGLRKSRSRKRHTRDKSSELANMFRNEIRWKEGPGWDWEAEGFLRGEEGGALGRAG